MNITITTDVFCDGDDCSDWTHGTCGARTDAKTARKQAKRAGWYIGRGIDLCPMCAKLRASSTKGEP